MKKLVSILMILVLLTAVAVTAIAEEAKWHLAFDVQGVDSEYWAEMAKGAELFCATRPEIDFHLQVDNNDENTQMQNLRDFIAQYGQNAIIAYNPCSAANSANIIEACEEAGVYCALTNNLAEGYFPEDFEYFVAHFTPDDVTAGYETAKYIFEKMGGKGNFCYLHGVIGQDAAAKRFEGVQKAMEEYPEIVMLDYQVADWDQGQAMTITEDWLAKYSDELNAVLCGNDTMALGAIEALKKDGRNGEVFVNGTDGCTPAYQAIKDGDLTCTIANNGYLLVGYCAAYATAAAMGEEYDEGCYYTKTVFVTAENVDDHIANFVDGTPTYDFTDLSYPILAERTFD